MGAVLWAVKPNLEYGKGLGRAFIGAALFALPLYMTMEMWQFGFSIDPARLALLLVVTLPALVGISHVAGFERSFGLVDDLLDAFAAIAVAALTASVVLMLFGVLRPDQPVREIVGKIAVLTFPGAIGALLADKQMNQADGDEERPGRRSYLLRLFVMAIGGVFVALTVAPTEEMMLIAFQISPLQAALLALISLALLHALLFWVDLPGVEGRRGEEGFVSVLVRYTFAGYALCVLISLYLLWTFGRADSVDLRELAEFAVVLAFPAVLGAGLAHFVVGERHGEG